MKVNKRSTALFIGFLGVLAVLTIGRLSQRHPNVVNVYGFYGMIPYTVLRQFEKETGIKVRFDVYDNNEILEAKLLATNAGYDVVMPTSPPYVARQIRLGLYQPLKKEWLPHLGPLNPVIQSKMEIVDPGLVYTIPYFWGTVGIAFDAEKIAAVLPGVDTESYDLLLNPENLKKLATHGVSFFEEAVDVFPMILQYLGKNPNSTTEEDLNQAALYLKKLRPFIRRFTSSRFINDLVMGDICLTQAWSGEAQQAIAEAKETGRIIQFVTPKEGAGLWIDCLAIPKGARNPRNAHAFINFMLRPEIAAQITNKIFVPTTIMKSLDFVLPKVRDNPPIYPPHSVMNTVNLHQLPLDEKTGTYERQRNRLWIEIRRAS